MEHSYLGFLYGQGCEIMNHSNGDVANGEHCGILLCFSQTRAVVTFIFILLYVGLSLFTLTRDSMIAMSTSQMK